MMNINDTRPDLDLLIEKMDAHLAMLSDSFNTLRRDMYETQRRMTDLETVMRMEHQAMREDCNEMFGKLAIIERDHGVRDSFNREASHILNEIALDRMQGWEAR